MTDLLEAPAPAVPTQSKPSPLALAVLVTGSCLIVLDFFIVNVALPSMQTDLHAGTAALEWVVAGYALTSAVFLLAAGVGGLAMIAACRLWTSWA